MLKKSRSIAVLLVCVVMFGVVEPACAWDWGGSFWGGAIGATLAGAVVVCTGGLALPLVPVVGGGAMIGAAIGGADDDPKSQAVAGTGAGLGSTILYEALKGLLAH